MATALAERLVGLDLGVSIVDVDDGLGELGVLVDLSLLRDGASADDVKRIFERTKAAVIGGARTLLVASASSAAVSAASRNGHELAAGVAGLLKSVGKERPDVAVRAVDLDVARPPEELAAQLESELLAPGSPSEVVYANSERISPVLVESYDRPAEQTLALTDASVIVSTGGARGITARILVELAERFGCHFELVGRTSIDGPAEDDEMAKASDAAELRRVLVERGELEAACRHRAGMWPHPGSSRGSCNVGGVGRTRCERQLPRARRAGRRGARARHLGDL